MSEAEHRSRSRGFPLAVSSPSGVVLAAGEFASGRLSREAQGTRSCFPSGRSARGGLFFGNFLLAVQKKVTCRGSATHKYIYCIDNPRRRRELTQTRTNLKARNNKTFTRMTT